MRNVVSIISIENGTVKVICFSGACTHCHSASFCRNKDTSYAVNNPENIAVENGDFVEVEIPEGKAIFTIFMSLLFPLVMFIPGYFVGKLLSNNEVVMAVTGFMAIGLGFLISYLFFRRKKKEYSPYIVRKL